MEFKGKSILMFSPKFFGYENEISKRLSELGANISLYDERPSNSFFTKLTIRIKPDLLIKRIVNHFETVLSHQTHFDYVFFFKGETALPEVLELVKKKQPQAKIILYLIDSIANYPHLINSINLFNKVLSFDSFDSEIHKSIYFRPLFYLNEYSQLNELQYQSRIDILFIGTVHSDRWPFLQRIKEQAELHGLIVFYYLYFQSPFIFFLMKIISKNYRTIPFSAAKFHSISKAEILELYEKTKVIVDIQHPKQTGLTMRTIEVFGAKRKLITTNSHIENYDLFNHNNILLVNRQNPLLDFNFINRNYEEAAPKVYAKYSIDSWLNEIFSSF